MKRFMIFGCLALVATLVLLVVRGRVVPASSNFRWPVMGTIAQLTLRGSDGSRGARLQSLVQDTFSHLESLLSAWDPQSELSRLSAAGCTNWTTAPSPEVRPCYAAALALAAQSGGAFNPQVGARLRELGVSGGRTYSDFDLGAIAKGFAVDVAAERILHDLPLPPSSSLLLDLGGNLRVVGPGTWRTGIRNPFDRSGGPAAVLVLTNGESIATSGNYERFIERDGRRLSHILDGRTGTPTHGIAAVTVVTPADYGALLADGLSTTLFILGPVSGAAFLARHHPRALALWIPDTPSAPRILATKEMASRLTEGSWPIEPAGADVRTSPRRTDP